MEPESRRLTIPRRVTWMLIAVSIVTIGKTVIASAAPGVRFRSEALFGHVVKRGYLGSALRFAGEVVDGTGEPADGVSVVVLAGNLDGSGMTPVASTVSAHRGRFLVRTPRGGPRLLAVEAGGTLLEEVRELVSPTVWVGVRSVRVSGGVMDDHVGVSGFDDEG